MNLRETVVDVRSALDFARGHLRGAVSLPYSEKGLAERLAVVLEPGARITIVAADPALASAAAAQLAPRYLVADHIAGDARRRAAAAEESFPDLPVGVLASSQLTVLDVREPVEWETGYAPGAILISLGRLREELAAIPNQKQVAVICEAGVRSSTAASLLQAAGFGKVATVAAGMSGYRRAGLRLQFPDPQSEA